jgi:DNA-binding NtrC family response regulator
MAHHLDTELLSDKPIYGTKLATRLMAMLIPSALIVLLLMGCISYWVSSEFLGTALARATKLHATTSAHAIEQYLDKCRQYLLWMAGESLIAEDVISKLERWQELSGIELKEFGFFPKGQGKPHIFVVNDRRIVSLPSDAVNEIRPNCALFMEEFEGLKYGDVWLSHFHEILYPFPQSASLNLHLSGPVVRLVTPYKNESLYGEGFLYLSIDIRLLRNTLSLFNSDKSPVYAFPRNPKFHRYTFFIDKDGWVLFQSEDDITSQSVLSTLSLRETLQGTLGRPDFSNAYRPSIDEQYYWALHQESLAGGSGFVKLGRRNGEGFSFSRPLLSYAPVKFFVSPDQPATVIGTVAYEDRSVILDKAGLKHVDTIAIISIVSLVFLVGLITFTARHTTSNLMRLAADVQKINVRTNLQHIRPAFSCYETELLRVSINTMVDTIQGQVEDLRAKDITIQSVTLKEPYMSSLDPIVHEIDTKYPEFIGSGPSMLRLKTEIAKASQVDVDVLIEGETGTGKQLAAEAIHRSSVRSNKPFISINCGELDENLLLDSLFGHVKGAFTDGKEHRQGAFLQADGGTLFLDEIQSASLKVQQALLRTLALRKVRPLGSDYDISVDFRLITATNANLKKLIGEAVFREDFYYRLKVVTIKTPALRDQKESIPLLVHFFLKEGERMAGKSGLSISRGAMHALMNYFWPGNVRELKHLIITAVIMSEGKVIHAEQLNLEGYPKKTPPKSLSEASPFPDEGKTGSPSITHHPAGDDSLSNLNHRQLKALDYLCDHNSLTCTEFIDILSGSISKRTAAYDLNDLVGQGFIIRVGKGPATRYSLAATKKL